MSAVHEIARHRVPAARGLARAQPATATALFIALALAVMVISNPVQVIVILAVILILLFGSGRLRAATAYLRVALYAGGFLLIINPLLVPGGLHVLWAAKLGPLDLSVTLEGLVFGVSQFVRLFALIMAFSIYSVVLDPDDQLSLMGRFSFRSGLVASLATRLFPLLSRDAKSIADAQRSRGIELDAGNRRSRVSARIPLLSALVMQSLERACDIAAAMETRGYGRTSRTAWRRNRRRCSSDILLAAIAGAMLVLLLAALVCGAFSYDFFPQLDNMWTALLSPWWLVLLVLLLTVPVSVSLPAVKRWIRSPR